MVADLGVRMEYINPQGTWYNFGQYTDAFSANGSAGIDTLLVQQQVEKRIHISPRLGISFPISEEAKLYFNYGHFYQQPTPDNMYLLRCQDLTTPSTAWPILMHLLGNGKSYAGLRTQSGRRVSPACGGIL